MGSRLTKVDMSKADYVELSDLNVTMTGYVCGTEDESLDTLWDSIMGHYGMRGVTSSADNYICIADKPSSVLLGNKA